MGGKRSSLGKEFRYLGMCAYVTCYSKLDESRYNAKLYEIMKSIDTHNSEDNAIKIKLSVVYFYQHFFLLK